ncbi:MAG TPA: hypothetical protein VK668_11245 [Mucilaginibacter sp.]|nr:hypothetical protein [Mucilaginibacter sp.]
MKNLILFALLALIVGFGSCQKSGIKPSKPKIQDTLSDSALFKVQLVSVKDTLPPPKFAGRIETLIQFNHAYHLSFINSEDASSPGIPGPLDPILNVMSITSDGYPVIVDGIPYKAGVTVPLVVTGKTSGQYILRAYYLRWFPADIHIWCKDNYLKDSVDLRKSNYNFTIDRTDANQYGNKRFSIILGPK